MVAIPVEAAEARNNGAIQVVSLQSGWLVAVTRAPVYDATKKPTIQPTSCRSRPSRLVRSSQATRPPGKRLPSSDRPLHSPKTVRAHDPTDIGDQDFISGARAISRHDSPDHGQPALRADSTTSDR